MACQIAAMSGHAALPKIHINRNLLPGNWVDADLPAEKQLIRAVDAQGEGEDARVLQKKCLLSEKTIWTE